MKKILIVNKYFSPDIGGVETVVKQHAYILKNDYIIKVLCVSKNFSLFSKNECIDGVTVLRCGSFGTFFSMPVSISFFLHYLVGWLRSDIIINHSPFPLMDIAQYFSKFFARRTNILFWHSDIVKQKKLKSILMPFIRSSLDNSTLILTTSPNLLQSSPDLKDYVSKSRVLPLFVDSMEIKEKTCGHVPTKNYDFIFFGRLCYYKGVDVLMAALAHLKERGVQPKVLIAGEGELSELVTKQILQHQLVNVTFMDRFLTEEEKYQYLLDSKCFLFPSVASSEAFGITQLESMALGTPVINTNLNTGVPYVSLNNVCGLTVEPNNPEQFAAAMLDILNDEERLSVFSDNCKVRVAELFEQQVVERKFKEMIDGVLK
ncbi:glycosyltransferase [Kluyvera sp. CHPC 1.251]|uniref:glycosyltransferase n=1 Tax=Kluyvera sp. CHPC 1.251 TaxID=2995175 RepID=UPI002FD81398